MAIVLGCGHQGTEQYIGLAFRRRSERSRRCTGGGCRTTIFFLLPLPVGLVGHYPKRGQAADLEQAAAAPPAQQQTQGAPGQRSTEIGRASCRERGGQYVSISVVAVHLKKKKINNKID